MSSKSRKRVLVLETDRLLSGGVSSLLKDRDDLDVIDVSVSGQDDLTRLIDGIKPDVIIFAEEGYEADIIQLIFRTNCLPRLRTININLTHNRVMVCDQRQIAIRDLSDFFAVL
jgi:chemotaxis response regulator CheB